MNIKAAIVRCLQNDKTNVSNPDSDPDPVPDPGRTKWPSKKVKILRNFIF